MTVTALLEARNVTRVLTGEIPVTLVRGVSLEVKAGEFIAITGPSGSGKSSLLYLLGLLDRPTEGSVLVNGVDTNTLDEDELSALRLEKLGFVFQSHFLLPEFSAVENVMMPMRRLGRLNDKAAREKAMTLLSGIGLVEHSHKLPHQLSGGQKQRVAIARALANDPLIIFADEPTGNLDSVSSATVQKLLFDIPKSGERAVVTVTHETDFAAAAPRRVHIVDGRIVEQA